MDKNLARRNMRLGIVLFIVTLCMLGISLLWANIYLNAIT
jgi:hypothetical protein